MILYRNSIWTTMNCVPVLYGVYIMYVYILYTRTRILSRYSSWVGFWFSNSLNSIVSVLSYPKENAQYARNLIDFRRDFMKSLRALLLQLGSGCSLSDMIRWFLDVIDNIIRFVCLHKTCKQSKFNRYIVIF